MSFVVDAVKKVFKKVKKFVKRVVRSDWFKVVAIAALTVFTAGVAAGGWAAFTGVNTVTGFFGAVGSTMANGWTAIASFATGNGFGLSTGQAATAASEAAALQSTGVLASGAEAGMMAGTAAGEAGVTLGTLQAGNAAAQAGAAAVGGSTLNVAAPLAAEVTSESITKAFLGKVVKGGKWLMSDGKAAGFARNALATGIMGYYDAKDRERQEFYFRNRTVWGNAAFGSEGKPLDLPTPKQRAEQMFAQEPTQEASGFSQKQQGPTADQTFGQGNLLTPQQQVTAPQPGSYAAQLAARSANAAVPQPNQPPPQRNLLGVPENLGVNNAV